MKDQLSAELMNAIEENPYFKIIPPAGFIDIIALEKNARLIVTDSGGLQKEAFFFEKPCVILRPQTEWVEIVNNGNAILADASKERIQTAFTALMNKTDYSFPPFYGDGKAAEFICSKIIEDL
jgi:UDP-GlcNAc3NAcA epimerase